MVEIKKGNNLNELHKDYIDIIPSDSAANSSDEKTPLLRMKGVTKTYGNTIALNHVDLTLKAGEVLVLIGENGAGKSTLMKILAGAIQKNKGDIKINGKAVEILNRKTAMELGISIVYQEQAMFPDLDAVENIFLGNEITLALKNSVLGVLDRHSMEKKVSEFLKEFDSMINLVKPVGELKLGERQIIEIIRGLAVNTSILILDEPTSALEDRERKTLFQFIKKLSRAGVAVIYCSHDLEEGLEIGDRFLVLRDGKKAAELKRQAATVDGIIELMVGKPLKDQFPKKQVLLSEQPVFSVKQLSHKKSFADVSFSVNGGEILGIAGLAGSGKFELGRAIFGSEKLTRGEIIFNNNIVNKRHTPQNAIKSGIAFLPADRKSEGLFLDHNVKHNITIANLNALIKGWIQKKREYNVCDKFIRRLKIKTPSIDTTMSNLSGGNQQKVMLARWLFRQADLFIFEEPTRGIDVNAKVEVYQVIGEIVEQGKSVILISSELPELVGICDRVLIMKNGAIVKELNKNQLSEESIAYYSVTSNDERAND